MFPVGTRFFFTLLVFLLPLSGKEELDLSPLKEALIKRDQYGSVISKVTQTKILPSLENPVTTSGKLWLLPQKAFRWEQGTPVTNIALYSLGKVSLINTVEKTVEIHDSDDREVRPLMLLLGIGKDSTFDGLLDNFDAVQTDQTDHTFSVTFTPDSGTMKRTVSELTLTLDLKTSFPKEITWKQKDGAVITTTFHGPTFNATVEEDMFFLPAEGEYKILKD